MSRRLGARLAAFVLLTGFKMELYTGLEQGEANQMLALLLAQGLNAKKSSSTGDLLTLSVETKEFVHAVELLRQHGFPHKKYVSVNELFGANQLVSSPLQEAAKLNYLKEQQVEHLLSTLEGVIQVSVVIAPLNSTQGRKDEGTASAAVFIKHAPDINMEALTIQIKSLVKNSVPGLSYEAITVVLQAAEGTGGLNA